MAAAEGNTQIGAASRCDSIAARRGGPHNGHHSGRATITGPGTCAGGLAASNNSRPLVPLQAQRPVEEWLSQWAHIWTRRRSPEWKPRRASVAACQLHQLQRQQAYEAHLRQRTNPIHLAAAAVDTGQVSSSSRIGDNRSSCRNISSPIELEKREKLDNKPERQHFQLAASRGQQPEAGECIPLVTNNKVTGSLAEGDDDESNEDNEEMKDESNLSCGGQEKEQTTHLSACENKPHGSNQETGGQVKAVRATIGSILRQDLTLYGGDEVAMPTTGAGDHCASQSSGANSATVTVATKLSKRETVQSCQPFNGSSAFRKTEAKFAASEQMQQFPVREKSGEEDEGGGGGEKEQEFKKLVTTSSATCCDDEPVAAVECSWPPAPFPGASRRHRTATVSCGSDLLAERSKSSKSVIGECGDMNEKLELQEKQRKFLILSMALKQMISNGRLATSSSGNENHKCRSKSCACLRTQRQWQQQQQQEEKQQLTTQRHSQRQRLQTHSQQRQRQQNQRRDSKSELRCPTLIDRPLIGAVSAPTAVEASSSTLFTPTNKAEQLLITPEHHHGCDDEICQRQNLSGRCWQSGNRDGEETAHSVHHDDDREQRKISIVEQQQQQVTTTKITITPTPSPPKQITSRSASLPGAIIIQAQNHNSKTFNSTSSREDQDQYKEKPRSVNSGGQDNAIEVSEPKEEPIKVAARASALKSASNKELPLPRSHLKAKRFSTPTPSEQQHNKGRRHLSFCADCYQVPIRLEEAAAVAAAAYTGSSFCANCLTSEADRQQPERENMMREHQQRHIHHHHHHHRDNQASSMANYCAAHNDHGEPSITCTTRPSAGATAADESHDLNLEALIVESWLDDHPDFVHDYFMRKASHQLIDDWLITHAKVSNTNLSAHHHHAPEQLAAPSHKIALNGHLNQLSAAQIESSQPLDSQAIQDQDSLHSRSLLQSSQAGSKCTLAGSNYLSARSNSGAATPVRKISATDFESRTGNGFLRSMVTTTPDGRPTFLAHLSGRESASDRPSQVAPATISSDLVAGDGIKLAADQVYNSLRPISPRSKSEARIELREKSRSPSASGVDLSVNFAANREAEEEKNLAASSNLSPPLALESGGTEVKGREDADEIHSTQAEDEEISGADEVKLIFELVKNICNDLDIRTLLHKILKNIAVLINADKSSLFLVRGQAGDPNRHLVSQLFNVDQDSEVVGEKKEETNADDDQVTQANRTHGPQCITIPWGTGLVGYVAESGESLNIANCYDDPRFTDTIDQRTGYVTRHMLCAPILDKRNEIVGVAQVINKRDGNPFSKADEIRFKRYLQFCGIGLRNAQSYEHCQLENRRNQVLLDLARMVFEEQSTIEQVVYRIMLHTQSLLECQRCQVLLIDDGSDDLDQLLQLPNSARSYNFYQQQRQSQQPPPPPQQQPQREHFLERQPGASEQPASQQTTAKPEWRPQACLLGAVASSGSDAQAPVAGGNQEEPGAVRQTAPANQSSAVNEPNAQVPGAQIGANRQTALAGTQKQQPAHHQSQTKLFSLVFDLECEEGNDQVVMHSNKGEKCNEPKDKSLPLKGRVVVAGGAAQQAAGSKRGRQFPINIGITGYVAMTGETLNIEDAHKNERFDPSVDEGSTFRHKSILCMPIRNGQRQIIGVSQLINKKNGRPFNKNDEDLFEAFAIFCGLGIHNTLMYERVLKIMAKQRVTFEVLSYHATAPLEEAKRLNLEQIPSCFALNLTSLKFNDFSLDEQFMLKACLRFFLDLDLIRRFQIDRLVFCNWILSVQKNYRKVTYHPIVGGTGLKAAPVRYHNWRHAFNVSQMMFAILINTQICQTLGELETLALLIACLCHDLDHRGTNNSFQIKSASPLAELYSTSTMEHHHFDQCVMILNSQGNQILANLSPEEYSRVIVLLKEAILATDLANYFQKRELFFKLVNSDQFDWQTNHEHRSLLRCMLMTACDVAAITKPWSVQKVVADLVMSEFYQQGDIERQELKIEPIDMMNRDKMSKLPEMQIGFIDSICAPIYTAFARLFPQELTTLLDGCITNRNLWTEMARNNEDQEKLASCINNNSDHTTTTTMMTAKHKNNHLSDLEVNICHSACDLNQQKLDIYSDYSLKGSCSLTSDPFAIKQAPVLVTGCAGDSEQQHQLAKVDGQRKSV